MAKRTTTQKERRKELDRRNKQEYEKYYSANQDEIRTCKTCGKSKPLSEFMSHYTFRSRCKTCHREKVRGWRKKKPESTAAIYRRSFAKSAEYIKSHKLKPCSVCGKKYPPCALDFHHPNREEKLTQVAKLYQRDPKRVDREIEVCDLVCANCHRDETQRLEKFVPVNKNRVQRPPIKEIPIKPGDKTKICAKCKTEKNVGNFTKLKNGYLHSYCKACLRAYNNSLNKNRKPRTSKLYIRSVKENTPCADCGKHYSYWVMDFDHVRGEKTINLSKLQNCSINRIKEEIAKCDVVCACCHRIRTWTRKSNLVEELKTDRDSSSSSVEIIDIELSHVKLKKANTEEIRKILTDYHYAGFGRPATIAYKATSDKDTIAVVKFAPVVRQEVATREGWKPDETLELDRFCIVPKFQKKNAASRVMSLVIKQIKWDKPKIKYLVSFADSEQGHIGTIYKASNWRLLGASPVSHRYEDKAGRSLSKKAVYNSARRLGLTERQYAESEGLTRIRTPGKTKYCYELRC